MNYVQGSAVSTCFMYDGRPAEVEEHAVWIKQAKELESRLAAEDADELEWERDVRYLLLELLEMLEEEVKDVAHSDDDDVEPECGFSRISKEYDHVVEAVVRVYKRCKAALP